MKVASIVVAAAAAAATVCRQVLPLCVAQEIQQQLQFRIQVPSASPGQLSWRPFIVMADR